MGAPPRPKQSLPRWRPAAASESAGRSGPRWTIKTRCEPRRGWNSPAARTLRTAQILLDQYGGALSRAGAVSGDGLGPPWGPVISHRSSPGDRTERGHDRERFGAPRGGRSSPVGRTERGREPERFGAPRGGRSSVIKAVRPEERATRASRRARTQCRAVRAGLGALPARTSLLNGSRATISDICAKKVLGAVRSSNGRRQLIVAPHACSGSWIGLCVL